MEDFSLRYDLSREERGYYEIVLRIKIGRDYMKIAHIVIEGENIRQISDIIFNHRENNHVSEPHMFCSGDIVVIMREGFYLRISSTLMSVIILKFINDHMVELELVTSGAKEGFLSISWGAENSENRSIVNEIVNICSEKDWTVKSIEPEELKKSLTQVNLEKLRGIINRSKK